LLTEVNEIFVAKIMAVGVESSETQIGEKISTATGPTVAYVQQTIHYVQLGLQHAAWKKITMQSRYVIPPKFSISKLSYDLLWESRSRMITVPVKIFHVTGNLFNIFHFPLILPIQFHE